MKKAFARIWGFYKNFGLRGIEILLLKNVNAKIDNDKIRTQYHKKLLAYLKTNVFNEIEPVEVSNIESQTKYLFCMWWDGYVNAPELVQMCIASLKNIIGFEVVILDKNNISSFITLSNTIIERYEKNEITKTHLSDIIRVNLLANYNCVWVDATVFISKKIRNIDKYNIFSISENYEKKYISKCRWTGFFMSCIDKQFLFSYAVQFFEIYWKKYNLLIDYYLLDYVYELMYENVEDFKNHIDVLPQQDDIYALSNAMEVSNDIEMINNICETHPISKLTWKIRYKMKLKDVLTWNER